MEVRLFRGLATAWIDDDDRALRVARDLADRRAGAREAVRLPRVLADEDRDLAVLEVAVDAGADHAAVHPELAGLLLRERVRAIAIADRRERRRAVRAAEMVPLAAAAVIEDLVAAVARLDVHELRGDLADRGVPIDRFEGPVRPAPERCIEPIAGALVEVEPLRLLAEIPARDRVVAIALELHDLPAAVSADLHLEPAVQAAQDAGRLPPLRRRCCECHGSSSEFRNGTYTSQFRAAVAIPRPPATG